MKLALLGFGTVGQAAARLLRDVPGLTLTHVFNRQVARKRVDWLPATVAWTEDVDEVLASRPDIVVEVVGGREPAGTWVRRALSAGAHVVTANKQLIAHEGGELLALAAAQGRHLAFEAAVAGGIPVIRAITDGLSADRITRVTGILNGTCNFILTRMADEGLGFDTALAEAQAGGFAEADPTDDLDGYDARAKLCVLARVALKRAIRPEAVACRSIRPVTDIDFDYARRLGCTIRQVSRAELRQDDTVLAWVQPALVRRDTPLASVTRNRNIVITTGSAGGDMAFSGFGAGGNPTAVAVVSDVIAIARGSCAPAPAPPAPAAEVTDRFPSPYYVRFVVRDRPGIVAAVAAELAAEQIGIDAVLQEPACDRSALPFVVTLDECDPAALDRAMTRIGRMDFHRLPPLAMPVL
ncbi:MAG: homoserine dehydrogenase [Vicinamibacterales bacterium]|nr:homoserine dehydrogenase [Vicinamibacterales bacterium]